MLLALPPFKHLVKEDIMMFNFNDTLSGIKSGKIVVILVAISVLAFFPIGKVLAEKTVAIFPFEDDSGYRGPWNLAHGLPKVLGEQLESDYFFVIPYDTVITAIPKPEKKKSLLGRMWEPFSNKKETLRIPDNVILETARKLGADLAITVVITDYNYSRFGAGTPMVGGYKSYKAEVELNPIRIIRIIDGKEIESFSVSANERDRGLGLELLGKPRDKDIEFVTLDRMAFGSQEFFKTLIGAVTTNAMKKAVVEIRNIVASPDMSRFNNRKIYILSRNKLEVNVNVGLDDAVEQGTKFGVYTEDGVRVGKIIITAILTPHLSKAEIIEGTANIRKDDLLKPE